MPTFNIHLGERYKAAFGIIAENAVARAGRQVGIGIGGKLAYWGVKRVPIAEDGIDESKGRKLDHSDISLQMIDPINAIGVSKMGTPVFDIVTLSHPKLSKPYTFDLMPMIDVSRVKHIVETDISGGSGEVVELISMKPWDIRFRGLLVDMESHQFPMGQLKELNELFEHDGTLKVESDLLNELGILELYFKDFNPEFQEGFRDTIAFTLIGRSHTPVEVMILERQ